MTVNASRSHSDSRWPSLNPPMTLRVRRTRPVLRLISGQTAKLAASTLSWSADRRLFICLFKLYYAVENKRMAPTNSLTCVYFPRRTRDAFRPPTRRISRRALSHAPAISFGQQSRPSDDTTVAMTPRWRSHPGGDHTPVAMKSQRRRAGGDVSSARW